ncbi:MAG: DUF4145 domain-containing protein [Elusimicrobiota bacterium]
MEEMDKKELESIPKVIDIYCNRCEGYTKHDCVWKSSREDVNFDEDESVDFIEILIYVVWRCRGCESISLQLKYTNSAAINQEGENVWDIEYHPIRKKSSINPKYFNKLPIKLTEIYRESVTAYNAKAYLLCAVGLRSLIEGVCKDKNIRGDNLGKEIDGLSTILPQNIVKNLHNLRFMGNDAVHELDPPTNYELKLAIEICEDLLNYLYELDYKTTKLNKYREFQKEYK